MRNGYNPAGLAIEPVTREPESILLADIVDAVRTLQIGRLTIEVHGAASAAQVMCELEAAVRERLGTRSLKDLIAAK